MKVEIFADAETVARQAAAIIAQEARAAALARGRFLLALSGGTTPRRMLELLAEEDIPWSLVHLFQVDERIAGATDPARNLHGLRTGLVDRVPLPAKQFHPMPVEEEDLNSASSDYATLLNRIAGTPPILDVAHLGLGEDGHTASLVPDDPVLDDLLSEVAITRPYHGFRRMTLTYPVLNRARKLLWLVTGADKAQALRRLTQHDPSIPAGRISPDHAVLLTEVAAGRFLKAEA